MFDELYFDILFKFSSIKCLQFNMFSSTKRFVDQFNTIEDALDVMERCGHPDATIILDPYHVFRGGGDMESILKLMPAQVAISHFNDTPDTPPREEQHDHNRVMPGEGDFELERFCALLRAKGFEGVVSCEILSDATRHMDLDEFAAQVYSSSRRFWP